MFEEILNFFSHFLVVLYFLDQGLRVYSDSCEIFSADIFNGFLNTREQNQILAFLIFLSSLSIIFARKTHGAFGLLSLVVSLALSFYERAREEHFDVFHITDIVAMTGLIVLIFSKSSLEKDKNGKVSFDFVKKTKLKIKKQQNEFNRVKLA